ncbi:MAG: thioesterase family protein [Acidimicrobiia bacterium]
MAEWLYQRDGDRLVPSKLVRGPWSAAHCHGGPPFGLLVTAIVDRWSGMGMTRATMDIPGPIPLTPVRIETEVLRPGKRITHVAATMTDIDGAPFARATAWMIRTDREVVPATTDDRDPPPDRSEGKAINLDFWDGEGDFGLAVEMVGVEGRPFRGVGGTTAVWIRIPVPLIAGELTNPYAFAAMAADFPNGIAALGGLDELICVNTDTTVYYGRAPVGDWIALRSRTNSSGLGLGMTDSLLYDASGFIGTANQSIFFDVVSRREPNGVP